MKTKLKSSIIAYHMAVGHRVAAAMVCALCAVGLSAFAADPSVTVGEVTAGEPWSTITVNYTLGGVDAATDYKVAFDITAGGQTASVTNDATKLTDGAATKEIDTAKLFGKQVVDTKAKVKVSLIAIKPKLGGVQLWEGGPIFAECNVGAEKPEEAGYYFWWGDTVGYKRNGSNDGWVSAKDGMTPIEFSKTDPTAKQTFDKDIDTLKSEKWIDGSGNLVVSDDETNRDAAREHLGAPWRMPTYAEFKGLVDECDRLAINTSGTEYKGDGDTFVGWRVTGRGDYSGNSIFLPAAAGIGDGSDLYKAGERSEYWSSTPSSDMSNSAGELALHSSKFSEDYSWRCYGASVRAVRDAK